MAEMEMDIPLLEELELLEATTSYYPEDEFDEYLEEPPIEEPSDLLQTQSSKNPSPTVLPETQSVTKKRSHLPNPDPPSFDKRSKIDSSAGTEIDDDDNDWLCYPPSPLLPRRNEPMLVEEALLSSSEPVVVVEAEVEKFVSRYVSEIKGECVPVTAPDGERVYAKIIREDTNKVKKLDLILPSKGLITDPIDVLIQKVELNAFKKVIKASVECPNDVILPEVPVVNEQLWVDKYAPNSFMELLSDEQTNREVLMWLKLWDSCVFGSEITSTTSDVLSALKRHSSVVQHPKSSSRGNFRRNKEIQLNKETLTESNNLDQGNYDSKGVQESWNKKRNGSGPPEHKILLLCGPPGLGKTTLAHVAARHCGYRVVEINASDDRASSTIEAKILDVVQMNSVMSNSRPKCLVIDEIDGALGDGKGAVDVILKMVSADKRSDSGKENAAQVESSGKMSAKKKHKEASLLRPVICICNDLYTPALRPLRQVAKVHIFVQPTLSRIVNRLKYICNKEGMKTNSISLTALAEYTECDIRSCLNTLQFLNKKKESLNVLDISSQVIGRKDTSKSVFDIWKEIFQKRRVKCERKSVSGCKIMLNEFDFLHSMISSRGDYDLIVDGIHENILQLRYHDPTMHKTVKCFHSLEVSDILNQYVMRTQRMSLQVYQPAIAITVHGLVAQAEKHNIEWPKSFQRYRMTLAEKVDMLHSWHNKLPPYISRHLSSKSFVEDMISPLLHILSPPTLRPVALHLLSEKEKKDMAQLITTMVAYSITYRNTKSDGVHGSLINEMAVDPSVLSFDPPIGEFIKFKGYTCNYFVLSAAVKQVLCHEVEKQKILQAGVNKSMHVAKVGSEKKQAAAGDEITGGQSRRSDNALLSAERIVKAKKLSNSRQSEIAVSDASTSESGSSVWTNEKLRSSEITQKHLSVSRNFFDRFKKLSASTSQMTDNVKPVPATMERDSRPILFKFNEGFTNAVKRPVRVREFLL